MNERRALLAKVHLAKKDLGLDDDVYRDILQRVTGERSAGALDERQLQVVVREMRRLGWSPTKGGKKPSSNPQVRKVWALWADLCKRGAVDKPTRAGLRAFVRNRTGVADPEWLSVEQAHHIIECLKSWQRRTKGGSG